MFGFNGKAVCLLTKAMFRYRVPTGKGALILYMVSVLDIFLNLIEIWRERKRCGRYGMIYFTFSKTLKKIKMINNQCLRQEIKNRKKHAKVQKEANELRHRRREEELKREQGRQNSTGLNVM